MNAAIPIAAVTAHASGCTLDYPDTCGLSVSVAGGRITAVRDSRWPQPIRRAHKLCHRGCHRLCHSPSAGGVAPDMRPSLPGTA